MSDLFLRINLLDGWLHPLSDYSGTCDGTGANSWLLASGIVSSATQRFPGQRDTKKAIELMIFYDALDIATDYVSLVEIARYDDSLYLMMINRVRERLDYLSQEFDRLSQDIGQGSL